MALGGRGPHKADINITPMIDVLLVLIIIFMVIAPTKEVGLHTMVPEPSPPPQQTQPRIEDIVVTVHKDGTLLLNQETVVLASLPGRFAQIYQARGDAVVFVRGDRDLVFAQIAEVIDMAKGAGLLRIALMTANPT